MARGWLKFTWRVFFPAFIISRKSRARKFCFVRKKLLRAVIDYKQ